MVGDRIKEARLKLGYSAEQVAAYLGISPATVYRYENGDIAKLPSKHIKPLAKFLCVSPAYLMEWPEDDQTGASADSTSADVPRNDDVRLLIRGLNRLSPEQFQQATNVFRAMFQQTNPELFERGEDEK